ncbi:hypothetical protein SK128_021623, partial [Halocaridina rubra]
PAGPRSGLCLARLAAAACRSPPGDVPGAPQRRAQPEAALWQLRRHHSAGCAAAFCSQCEPESYRK